jgi:D-aspartate ligase
MLYLNTAVILGLFDTGVATARSLARLGIPVEGYDYLPDSAGFRSKYFKAKLSPNPSTHPEGFLELLIADADRNEQKILYPCADEYVFFISRFRDHLSPYYKFLLPDHSIIEVIIDKSRQIQFLQDLNIPVPATYFANSMDNISQIGNSLEFPAFIKPVYIYKWREIFDNKGFIIHNREELLSMCKNIFSHNFQIIIQGIVPGDCTNNYEVSVYVGTDGDIMGELTIRKLRQYPADLGSATLTVSTRNKDVEDLSHKILRDLTWRGFANIEFKYDIRDRTYKFIEVNARVWQQIGHGDVLGINFPLLQYLDLTGIKPEKLTTYGENIKWVDIKSDLLASFQMFLKGTLSVREWINSLKGARDFGLFAADDLRPFLHSIHYGLSIFKLPGFLFRHLLKKK